MTDNAKRALNDAAWLADGEANGWAINPHIVPSLPWRVWGVRHVRFAYHAIRAARMAQQYASVGIGLGGLSRYDKWVLYAILRGWA